MHRALATLVCIGASIAPLGGVAAQGGGVLRGTVRSLSGTSIRGAMVGIPGSTLYTQTDGDGRYRLTAVPAGEIRLRAAAIGYSPVATVVTLAGGDSATVGEIAASEVVTVGPKDTVRHAVELMHDHQVAHLLVVEPRSDRPLGVVSTLDVARLVGGLARTTPRAGSRPSELRAGAPAGRTYRRREARLRSGV